MIVGINKRRFSFFILFIITVVAVTAGYKPVMKKFFYPKKYSDIVDKNAQKYGVDANLIYAVIKSESGFDETAVSHAGAKGLMQLTDETADWIMEQTKTTGDIFSPETNIFLGTWYIARLLRDNDGNIITALASYNAGGTNVKKWQNEAGTENILPEDIPFEETENYVSKTIKYYKTYKKLWN